jgi:hypothetical protein
MSVDDLDLPVEPELDARLRRTLAQVAMTIGDTTLGAGTPPAASLAPAGRPRRRRWRSKPVLIGVALAAILLAGFAYVQLGPEHVTEQMLVRLRQDALVTGGVEPNRYWLVPAFHTECGQPMPGVELVEESTNWIGGEWSTTGIAYGEPIAPITDGRLADAAPSCLRYDERVWLTDPSRFALGLSRLGQHASPEEGDLALLAAVHPTVRTLRVITPGTPVQRVSAVPRADHPNGPRYALIVLPAQATRTHVVLLDEQGVPVSGGTRNLTLSPSTRLRK